MDPAVVRPALERALEVARQGVAATPSVAAPKELVRYLDFQKLTGPALAAVQRVLDSDDDFRRRVLASTTPEDIGAAGWLALSRPAGWEDMLRAVAEADAEVTGSDAAARQVRDLQRALEASERKRTDAQEAVVRQRKESEAIREELASVRKERRRAEEALATIERRVDELEQKLDDRETRLTEAQGAREAREHELAETQRLLAEAHTELARRPAPLVPGERAVDVGSLRDAASRLQRAAATLARAVDGVLAEVPPEPVLIARGVDDAPLRAPLSLPGGVVADTVDGARWLLARPDVVLLVDGYNVAKSGWPDDVLEQQRERLIRALNELVMRTGATAEIVFDGPEDTVPGARHGTRSVGVRYSGGAIADDVVVDLVDAYPVDRPVVVISTDREVRDAARAKGATVIGSDTLIALFSA
ncbi:MAG: NYN domain-containing protein [Acidimicrobiales bacterium]